MLVAYAEGSARTPCKSSIVNNTILKETSEGRSHSIPFIDPNFCPAGQPDRTEYEGGKLDEEEEELPARPWATQTTIKLPPPSQPVQSSLTIRIPAQQDDNNSSDDEDLKCQFCPKKYCEKIITMLKDAYCAHPFIPGYAADHPTAIREWAVCRLYNICFKHDLPELWAYLWMNWLRPEHWILWACSAHPDMILILKTTMMVESHWRHIKRDFLYHFSLSCIDLLVWILVKKLAPEYYCKIDCLQHPVARYRELHSWRKSFKREWKKCLKAQTTLPSNRDRYHPDPIC